MEEGKREQAKTLTGEAVVVIQQARRLPLVLERRHAGRLCVVLLCGHHLRQRSFVLALIVPQRLQTTVVQKYLKIKVLNKKSVISSGCATKTHLFSGDDLQIILVLQQGGDGREEAVMSDVVESRFVHEGRGAGSQPCTSVTPSMRSSTNDPAKTGTRQGRVGSHRAGSATKCSTGGVCYTLSKYRYKELTIEAAKNVVLCFLLLLFDPGGGAGGAPADSAQLRFGCRLGGLHLGVQLSAPIRGFERRLAPGLRAVVHQLPGSHPLPQPLL